MPFWVCANRLVGTITVGKGMETSMGDFVASAQYSPNEMMPIDYVGFSTGWGSTGSFQSIRIGPDRTPPSVHRPF